MGLTGKVYLVGAGPGDAGLLTMRGAELLRRADVVVYDALVNRELLALAPEAAEVIFGGKRPREQAIPQEELNRLLVDKARDGKTVVRLKGGDPYIFGRGGEEAAGLKRDGVPFEVVPGISSIIAAPSYAGIPLTSKDHREVAVVTCDGTVDWSRYADERTLALLSGVGQIGEIAKQLNNIITRDTMTIVPLVDRGRVSAASNTLGGVILNTWDSELWNAADWYRVKE